MIANLCKGKMFILNTVLSATIVSSSSITTAPGQVSASDMEICVPSRHFLQLSWLASSTL